MRGGKAYYKGVNSREAQGVESPFETVVYFRGLSTSKMSVLTLLSKAHWPYIHCIVVYRYDEFCHSCVAIEIFLIVGYTRFLFNKKVSFDPVVKLFCSFALEESERLDVQLK